MARIYTLIFIIMLAIPTHASAGDIYLFRGLIGSIFSTGLNDLGRRLKGNGHRVRVLSHRGGFSAYRQIKKRGRPVALAGHSMGGKTAYRLAKRLRKNGIKVCLLATIDPVGNDLVPSNVRVALNWWNAPFKLKFAGRGFHGTIQNFHMKKWRHIDLDSADVIHNRIATVMGSRCR